MTDKRSAVASPPSASSRPAWQSAVGVCHAPPRREEGLGPSSGTGPSSSRIDNSRSSFSLFGGKRSVRLARRSCSAGREGESAPLRGGSPRKAPHTHIDTDEPLMNSRRREGGFQAEAEARQHRPTVDDTDTGADTDRAPPTRARWISPQEAKGRLHQAPRVFAARIEPPAAIVGGEDGA